jgi:uncharacterized protein
MARAPVRTAESEAKLKCPRCNTDLAPVIRHKIKVNACPSCKGMWLERQELEQLEDEVFDFGEHAKGTLVADSTPTTDKCPECNAALSRFRYRFYDLEMELCENQHGFWLEADEDSRVLELMKREEADLERKLVAEDRWAATLKRLRSGSFLERFRDLFR